MTLRLYGILVLHALVLAPSVAGAGALRLVSTDRAGATLEFTLPAHSFTQVTRPEGTFWRIEAPGLKGSVAEEGRPSLPAESALLGIPDGTIASVRVVSETASDWAELTGKEIEPLGKQQWNPDGKDYTPVRVFYRDPAFDQPWPAATAELGAAGTWRRQRVASVRVNPFRVDPAAKTVRVVTQATIRVDFVPVGAQNRKPGTLGADTRPAPANDRWEGLYERALLNYDQAKSFRVEPQRATRRLSMESFGTPGTRGAAYDPLTEWSIQVDTTGVYRVTFAQLQAKGFPAGTPVAQLTLTRRAFARDQSPPFLRLPVPIQVIEDPAGTAGTFDAQDAVVFYGQDFLDQQHPSDFRRRFGDASVYYVGVDPASGGPRMALANADLGLASPTRPTSFPSYRMYERRFQFNYLPKDTCGTPYSWSDQFADVEFADTLTMWTPDVEPTGTVRFRSTWEPFTYSPYAHTIWARWKRPSDGLLTPVATLNWSDKTVVTADTTFAADRIAAGTNRFEWRGFSFISGFPEGGPSGAALRNFEVTYPRHYRAFQNRLDFNSSDASGDVEIEVDGFTSAASPTVLVYDVTDSTAPRAITGAVIRQTGASLWAARFQDQVAAGTRRRYFAFLAPPSVKDAAVAQAPRAYATPIWSPPGRPDIVIVTPDEFRTEAERLAVFRRSQGYDVLVAPLSEVWDAFDEGRRSDWAIRRLFAYAFDNWDSRFAVLFGDGNDDDRGVTNVPAPAWVPVHLIQGPVGTGAGNELSPSEFWYVNDLDDNVPPPPSCATQTVDPFPDMAIGRIPVGSLAQAQGLVDKLIAYETTDQTADWRNKALLVPDDAYSGATFSGDPTPFYCFRFEEQVFEKISDNLESVIKNEGGYRDMNVEQFRLREKLLPLNRPVPGDPSICQSLDEERIARDYVDAYTRPQLLTELGNGALVFNFQGHGSQVQLAHERIWAALGGDQSVDFMFNEGKPPIFMSFSCHVNQFSNIKEGAFGDALGDAMVIGPQNPPRPSAGAIASYASTNYELLPTDGSGSNHLNVWLFRAMFVDPPHDQLEGQSGARVLLGEALTLGAVEAVSNAFGLERRAIETYCLLGDPVTRMETGAPRMFATANGFPVTSGARFQPGAPGDSVAVVLDLLDESRIDDLALTITGEGARPVDPSEWSTTPSYPDTLNGGAGRRYLLTWNARPTAKDQDLVVTAHDRYGLATTFVLPLRLEMRLFANGQPISNGDIAPSTGPYQIVVSSPAQLSATDIGLTIDGAVPADLIVTPAPTDSSRRLWTLSWTGGYQTGEHDAAVTFPGGAIRRVSFLTSTEPRVALSKVYAFPTPFAAPPVTINFTLDADQPSTVAFKVYSVSGSLVYQRVEQGVSPGYHQWIWDGRDDRADDISNGTYLYQVIAQDDRGLKAIERGKLARLR